MLRHLRKEYVLLAKTKRKLLELYLSSECLICSFWWHMHVVLNLISFCIIDAEYCDFGKINASTLFVFQIKLDLFMYRFKDHKRCTYMIVSALDGNDTLTAAQVSHKLKQQLAYVPH